MVILQRLVDALYTSTDLRHPAVEDYLQLCGQVEALCNTVTAVVSPQMYDSGLAAMELIKDGHEMHHTHAHQLMWPSMWSGASVIVNRETPDHRDPGASPSTYNLLVAGGTHTECSMRLPDLGATLRYLPGTLVAVSGKIIHCGVPQWVGGERFCIAHFIKDAVLDRLEQKRPQ